MVKKNLVLSCDRGNGDIAWLKSKFSFSFANYYNPKRMNFGKLRVFNDDIFASGKGFGMHPHDNMEIITIVLEGYLKHEDSMGNSTILEKDFIQVMSAGNGLFHSEINNSSKEDLKLFQIWIDPSVKNVDPRHDERKINFKKNELQLIVSGDKNSKKLFIHQDAKLYLGKFDKNKKIDFVTSKEKGLFILVVDGSVSLEEEILNKRDCLEITEIESTKINFLEDSYILILEVPM